jgi:hypothetical protein
VRANDGAEEEDEVEIEHLVVELPEGDDPSAGQAIAEDLIHQLSRLLES